MGLYDIELEPEVRSWLDDLSDRDYGRVMAYAELLAEEAETLGEPYSRHLGGKVRELLLTVFRKTRQDEDAEIGRARRAQKECEAEHGHAESRYEREV